MSPRRWQHSTHDLHLTITTAIHARWAHRVDGLIHSHPWSLEATVEGPTDAEKVIPADDLEQILHDLVEPWRGHYLTDEDVGNWKGYEPLVWDREPTVEEIARRLWEQLDRQGPRPGVDRPGGVDGVRPLPDGPAHPLD